MQEQINQLQNEIQLLKNTVSQLQQTILLQSNGSLDDILVERVINADVTNGTPPIGTNPYSNNNLLYQVALTGLAQDIKVLNFPTRVMIYTWKNQRLAIPVYDATNIIYP